MKRDALHAAFRLLLLALGGLFLWPLGGMVALWLITLAQLLSLLLMGALPLGLLWLAIARRRPLPPS